MRKLKLFLSISIILILITSCSKYDDNQGLTLPSKSARLTQEWHIVRYEWNGDAIGGVEGVWDFSEDEFTAFTGGVAYSGSWEFRNNKEKIRLAYDFGAVETWTINRLEKDNFWATIRTEGFPDIIIDVELEPAD